MACWSGCWRWGAAGDQASVDAHLGRAKLGDENAEFRANCSPSEGAAAGEKATELPGYPNGGNIIRLGVGFFSVFAAYVTQQNFLPSLLQELGYEQVGFVSVAVIYGFFFFSCLVAPAALERCSERIALPTAAALYAPFMASGLLFTPAFQGYSRAAVSVALIASAALVGISAPFVWVSKGMIMAFNSPQNLVNDYEATFQVLFMLSNPAGALLSYALLGDTVVLFVTFACMTLFGSAILATLRPPLQHASIPTRETKAAEGRRSVRDAAGPVLAFLCNDKRARPLCALSAMLALYFNAAPGCVLPKFAADMGSVARMLTANGLGSCFASIVFGRLAERVGRRACLVAGACAVASALLLLVFSGCGGLGIGSCMDWMPQAASFLFGFGGSTMFATLFACITAAVHDKVDAANASAQSMSSFVTMVAFLVLPLLSAAWVSIAYGAFLCLGIGYILTWPSFFETLPLDTASDRPCGGVREPPTTEIAPPEKFGNSQ